MDDTRSRTAAPLRPAAHPAYAPSRYRPVVMMVEDDPDDRRIYGSVLCYNGFNVVLVPDGANARRVVSLLRPDLILLDIGLPDGDGLELCPTLARTTEGSPVPVVALSGFHREQMEPRARASGCSAYIEKPTSPVDVLHTIEGILGRAPAAGEGPSPWMIRFPFGEADAAT